MNQPLHVTLGALFVVGCLTASGCSWLYDSDDEGGRWRILPGAIIFVGDTTTVTLSADTVQAGTALRVYPAGEPHLVRLGVRPELGFQKAPCPRPDAPPR